MKCLADGSIYVHDPFGTNDGFNQNNPAGLLVRVDYEALKEHLANGGYAIARSTTRRRVTMKATTTTSSETRATWESTDAEAWAAALRKIADLIDSKDQAPSSVSIHLHERVLNVPAELGIRINWGEAARDEGE